MLKAKKDLVIRDWKQDVIHLVQFPRCGIIPSPSPFALKLETWLRFVKLNYTNVSNDFKFGSAKGQIPFIEVNGRQLADSSFIISNLKETYNLDIDRNLNSRERADERAYTVLIEESLFRSGVMYNRSRNFSWLGTEKGFLGHFTGVKKFLAQKVGIKVLQNKIKSAANAQGIGRHSPAEVDEIAKKDLTALSTFLGDKAYFFGNHPSTLDATAFGVLAQIIETPLENTDIKSFIEQSTPNLLNFVRRIQRDYWPDWDVLCKNLVMNASDPPKPSAEEKAAAKKSRAEDKKKHPHHAEEGKKHEEHVVTTSSHTVEHSSSKPGEHIVHIKRID